MKKSNVKTIKDICIEKLTSKSYEKPMVIGKATHLTRGLTGSKPENRNYGISRTER